MGRREGDLGRREGDLGRGFEGVCEIWGRTLGGQDRGSGLMGIRALSSTHPASSLHPAVPALHPGEAAAATFLDMSGTLDPAAGRAHIPVLVRTVGTPPSHGCHTSPHDASQCQCWAWPSSRSAWNNPAFERDPVPAARGACLQNGPILVAGAVRGRGLQLAPSFIGGGWVEGPGVSVGSWHAVGFGGLKCHGSARAVNQ